MKRYTIYGEVDLVKVAIQRLRDYEEIALQMNPNGYYVAYSGGKDSDTIRILCELAGVKHELWHNHTTVDAPETIYYVRSIPKIHISYPETSMWDLIIKKGMPPLKQARYCCSELKETNGHNRFVVTGVRWSESTNRAKRGTLEIVTKHKKDKVIFMDDNVENRRQIEHCPVKGRLTLNPIIEWNDGDVWEFLNYYGYKSNPLYKCGFKRIGCIGYPMAGYKHRLFEFERYPKYKELYIHAFDQMIKHYEESGKKYTKWTDGESVFDWWTSGKAAEMNIEEQINLWKDDLI
ncbi:MAG: phosphoadenosine phosphosulfate reductase family protein [Oscillospiraceae bacterium]|nr:phosphoadenosine phosphosulfate reductase family protein [Oscillospiraceae bacterium]